MAIISITEAARLAGKARSTLYRKIERGELSASKQPDGSDGIDTSELFRVFGEPATSPDASRDGASGQEAAEHGRAALQAQIELLREQLDAAREREDRLLRMVEHSQRLLEPPKRGGFIERIAAAIQEIRRRRE